MNLGEARHRVSVDRHDAIFGHEHRVRRFAGEYGAYHRRQELAVLVEDRGVEQDRKEDVHRRPREHDDDALPELLRLERAVSLFGQDGLAALAFFEHLHEATEGEDSEAVLGLAPSDLHELRPEPHREGEHLHAEDLREREVPSFVDEDEHAHEDHEVEQVHRSAVRDLGRCTTRYDSPREGRRTFVRAA